MEDGYSRLTVQIGHGKYIPETTPTTGLPVTWYRFKASLARDMEEASLIISHGGIREGRGGGGVGVG